MSRLRLLVLTGLGMLVSTGAAVGAEAPPPSLEEACGSSDLAARSLWVRTADGVRLYVVDAGTGKTTVVLGHGGRADLCQTLTFASRLVSSGYRVVALDFRGWGRSQRPERNWLALGRDYAAAVAHARRTGAERVFLIGSSMGGAAIAQNTASIRVDGRISLSGMRLWNGFGINDRRGPARIRAPFLYVGTRGDRRAPVGEVRTIFRRIGARDKRIAFYRGVAHGWEVVDSPRYANARALVLRWLADRSAERA
jgi:pimeloyl-ACP methyl ester carboxylesterase